MGSSLTTGLPGNRHAAGNRPGGGTATGSPLRAASWDCVSPLMFIARLLHHRHEPVGEVGLARRGSQAWSCYNTQRLMPRR